MITDQFFWRRDNGAHQRIDSLTRYLIDQGFELVVFFMVERPAEDLGLCQSIGCKFVEYDPGGGGSIDLISPVLNAAKQILSKKTDDTQPADSATSLKLSSYRWPHAQKQFQKLIESFKPDIVLSQYLVWSYLLEGFSESKKEFRSIVDTHDALHVRNEQFKKNNKVHWLDISRDEEADALSQFDLVLSIQDKEEQLFRELVPNSEVMIVGHSPVVPGDFEFDLQVTGESEKIRIGYIGSNNHANVDGIEWFLRDCWPTIIEQCELEIELLIGGPLYDVLKHKGLAQSPSVKFSGFIESVAQFYQPLDFVINPVRFGSGLKIKTVEAFCFGRPLVAHSHSLTGLSDFALKRVVMADDTESFILACLRLACSPSYRSQMAQRSRLVGQTEFSDENVYSALSEWIKK